MKNVLISQRTGQPLRIWAAKGPKQAKALRAIKDLGGKPQADSAAGCIYALVDETAADLQKVYGEAKKANHNVVVLQTKWIFDCLQAGMRLDNMEYEVAEPTVTTGRRATRTEYTPADDKHLVKYLVRHADLGRTGNAVYQHMEKKYPRHTWQSWRERYKKNELRFDREIAKYSRLVHERRWNQEEPYSDSDAEQQSQKPAIAVTADVPVCPRTAAVGRLPAAQAEMQPRFKPLSLIPMPTLPALATTAVADTSATSTIRQPLSEVYNVITNTRKLAPAELLVLSPPAFGSSPRKRKISQVDPVAEAVPTVVASRNSQRSQRSRPTIADEHADLSSKALPATLTRDNWDPNKLEYGISGQQMTDLIYCCSGSKSLAIEFVRLIADGPSATTETSTRLQVLSNLIWRRDEDVTLIETRDSDSLPAGLLRRHSRESIAERRRFLVQHMAEVGKIRFPFDVM